MTSMDDAERSLILVRKRELRERLRFLVSLIVAGTLGWALWSISPGRLGGHINIVGYPTFANFAFQKSFLAYRLLVWELPIVSALVYALLRWRGPLREPVAVARGRIELVDLTVTENASVLVSPTARRVLQLAAPAALVVLAVSSRRDAVGAQVDPVGLLAGVGYIAVVLVLSALVARLGPRPGLPGGVTARGEALSLVSCFTAALVSVAALVQVSGNTLVITTGNQREHWPWFPVWLALATTLAVLIWIVWRLKGGWPPSRVERRVRAAVVGSVAIFLLKAAIPAGVSSFTGFDDAQSVVGADLLTRGYFPWRDFMFIHGLFEDALSGSIGFGIFEHSVWGVLAGLSLIVVPLFWVGQYLLAMWAGRSGSLLVLGVLAVAAWGGFPSQTRFVAMPYIFILLGVALSRGRPSWTVLFTCAIFVEAVLVPEASFQVIAAVITIVAVDVVHRDPERSWWHSLRRTRYFVATGAGLAFLLAIFLVLNNALGPFLNYYRTFAPNHAAAGAIPPSVTGRAVTMFLISSALVVLTLWMVAWRLFGRHSWTARDWLTVSAAILTGLYGEKALGRFDFQHVDQTLAVALPLWILWVARCLDSSDDFLGARLSRMHGLRPARGLLRRPVSVVALALTVLFVPAVATAVRHVPGNTKRVVGSSSTRLVGYQNPGAIDATLLADLRAVTRTYAGAGGAIFDSTNSPGYFYYLLQRAPASVFVHVSMALPEVAQRQVVEQLAKSRPALVAFDNDAIGLPLWEVEDSPRNNVRHFEVAQSLLDGWTPILRSHSVLFMLRNDLVATRPAVPTLTFPPQTADLFFSNPTCDWGYAANFLDSRPSTAGVSLPVTDLGGRFTATVSGWTFDTARHAAPSRVVVTTGSAVIADAPVTVNRQDVAASLNDPAAAMSGFEVPVTSKARGPVRVYGLGPDGALHPVGAGQGPAPGAVQMPDGRRLRVTESSAGAFDGPRWRAARLGSVAVPASVRLASLPLATFVAPTAIGDARLSLSDQPPQDISGASTGVGQTAGGSHEITAKVLPMAGASLPVRVGSCLQWHGYQATTLYLLQRGGVPITGVRLSGVRD